MIKIKNLSEAVRKQIRLIPAEGATSDITGSTGAIAKDGEDILICLSPMVPPVQVSMTLRIIPVDKIAGLKSYYANGSTPVTPDRKIYHDLRVGDGIDVVLFSELTDEPIEVNPSDTFQSINATTAWPNPMGYLANDLREFQDTVQYHVKFPSALIAEIRAIRNETPNEVVLVEEYVDLLNAENSDTRTLTASEFINVIDNNIYFFWFGADDNPGELSYKFNLGGEEILYKIKSNLTVTKRWNPDLITLNTGINIHGLFSGLDGYGFIEFKSDIPRTDDSVEDGGGSMYQDVKANGSGGLITLGVRESIEAYVTPTGDAYIKPLLDGINNVQFSLLTETDMDLSDRGTGIPGLACHYMKTSIPEHKLFHHRFFFTYTTIVTPACVPSDPVTLVNKKLDIAQGDVIRIAGRLETESGTQVLTGTYTVDNQLLALNALYAEDINWFNMGAKFYPTGTGDKDTMISPVLASDYPPDFVWHADPRTITYDTCANLGVTLQAGELDFVRDILQVTEPVVIHTCGYVTSS